ncbi:MAG: YgiT-type zinc finger protein [Chloroflexi bacterium]|nr:YgiT-type zinc finger protein [Chloroflexota bacterium]
MTSQQRCLYCQGPLVPRRVTRVQEVAGRWVVIENLPALVCAQCGAQFYTPEVHDWVLALTRGEAKPVRIEQVDVYDATQVA